MDDRSTGPGPNPLDTWLSGGLRFLTELIAWTAGPWAMGRWTGLWGAGITLVVLVALPAVFSVPGDKHQVVIPIPGPVRFSLELDLALVAAIAPWFVWTASAAVLALIVVVAAQATGWRRSLWLLKGAEPFE